MNNKIINGNNIELLKQFPDNHFDSIVTDPPYGLGKEPNAQELMTEKMYSETQLKEAMDDACIKGFNNNLGLRFNHLYRKDYIDKYIKSIK